MPFAQDQTVPTLDELPELPRRNKASIGLVLVVQALNSFNDNFVKMLFIALALAVAAHTELGDKMQVYLGLIFSLPYILFAPMAGFLSDRFSKKRVTVWMQLAQMLVFGVFTICLWSKDAQLSLKLSLAGFFLLATQAAFFSPAKMGMMKELAGSRRLGMVSGWLQMSMMAAILSGMWAGGKAFGDRLHATNDPWHSALFLVTTVGCVSLLQFVCALGIQPTPTHPEVKFRTSLIWEHFSHLRFLFRDRPIRLASFGITYFWFLSNALATILVTLGHEAPPADPGEAAKAMSIMAALLGFGIVLGSLAASAVCKRRIELGLVPLAGLGLAAGLLWTGLLPVDSRWIHLSLIFIGANAGCFMVPLYAYVQDRAAPSERARILSGVNLMDCLAGVAAMGVVWLYLKMGMRSSVQVLTLVVPSLVASACLLKLLPRHFVRILCLPILRSIYKVRAVNPQQVPRTGGVLILANHSTYIDALLLHVAFERHVRFVMWDSLYNVSWMTGFLRLFDTVPISPSRAKDAIRTVVAALKEGQAVCLFPEGQITRCGAMNEIRKGFEIMVRQAGVPVVPVYLDGLWGSIFSFERGRVFTKRPRFERNPIIVQFGEPIAPASANTSRVREAMLALGSQAFLSRRQFKRKTDAQALANMMRIAHVNLFNPGDTLLVLADRQSIIARSLALLPDVTVVFSTAEAERAADNTVVAIGDAQQLRQLTTWNDWPRTGKFALCWQSHEPAELPELGTPVLRGWLHEPSGALLSTEFPDPSMPGGEEGQQLGRCAGTLGRLLPGLAAHQEPAGLSIRGVAPEDECLILLAHGRLDDLGFVTTEA